MSEARLPADLDRRLVDAYRAWDAMERAANGIEIVDFDLASPRTVAPAESRAAVAERLGDLLTEATDLDSAVLVRERLKASLAYLRALEGEQIGIDDYIQVTLGTTAIVVPEDEIAAQREAVSDALQHVRPLHHGEGSLRFSSEDFHRFQSLFLYPHPEKLPRLFEYYRDKWLPPLVEQLHVDFDRTMVQIEFASEDAYWKNWISGNLSERRVVLRINYHPRHTWYQGAPEALVLHEYCGHAVQMVSWYDSVRRQQLSDFGGILTVHFPDQFILEGLAEAVIHVLPDGIKLEPKTVVFKELNDHSLMVWNNVHLIANREGPGAAQAYAVKHLPFSPLSSIEAEIRDRTEHPLFRSYQYVYGVALRGYLQVLGGLDRRKQWDVLRRVYRGPMLPQQFLELRATI